MVDLKTAQIINRVRNQSLPRNIQNVFHIRQIYELRGANKVNKAALGPNAKYHSITVKQLHGGSKKSFTLHKFTEQVRKQCCYLSHPGNLDIIIVVTIIILSTAKQFVYGYEKYIY